MSRRRGVKELRLGSLRELDSLAREAPQLVGSWQRSTLTWVELNRMVEAVGGVYQEAVDALVNGDEEAAYLLNTMFLEDCRALDANGVLDCDSYLQDKDYYDSYFGLLVQREATQRRQDLSQSLIKRYKAVQLNMIQVKNKLNKSLNQINEKSYSESSYHLEKSKSDFALMSRPSDIFNFDYVTKTQIFSRNRFSMPPKLSCPPCMSDLEAGKKHRPTSWGGRRPEGREEEEDVKSEARSSDSLVDEISLLEEMSPSPQLAVNRTEYRVQRHLKDEAPKIVKRTLESIERYEDEFRRRPILMEPKTHKSNTFLS